MCPRAAAAAQARLQGTTLEALEAEHVAKVEAGTFEYADADAEAAAVARASAGIAAWDCLRNSPRWLYNGLAWTIGARQLRYDWTPRPLNLGAIIRTIAEAHAHQIFVDGVVRRCGAPPPRAPLTRRAALQFNGDPHPGNVLLLPDGRLGLIDYGQVKRWTLDQQLAYAELTVALADGDRDEIIRAFTEEVKIRTQDMDPDVLYRLAVFWNDRNSKDITMGLNLQEFQDWAEAKDPQTAVPNWPVIASRVNVLMRAVGNAFGLDVAVAHMWAPYARAALRRHGPAGGRAVDLDRT